MEVPELLFVGSGRWVAALDRFSGRPVWRRKLPRFFGGLLTVTASGGEVYVGRGGYVYCLDSRTGDVMWERGLGGSGTVLMALPGVPADQQAVGEVYASQQAAIASGAAAG